LEHPWAKRSERPEGWWGPTFYSTLDESKFFHSYEDGYAFEKEEYARRDKKRDDDRAALDAKQRADRVAARDAAYAREVAEHATQSERFYRQQLIAHEEEMVRGAIALVATNKRKLVQWDAEGGPKTADERATYNHFLREMQADQKDLDRHREKLKALLSGG
jgi:hypothetical protein